MALRGSRWSRSDFMFVTTHLEYSQRVWLHPNSKKQRSISHAYLYSYLSTETFLVQARHCWLFCGRSLELELPNFESTV
jgi:hypothetical protein